MTQQMSRAEVERRMERGYIGKVVSFTDIRDKKITGKMQRLSIDIQGSEVMVIFIIDRTRYEADIHYFFENIQRHGNTNRSSN